MILQAGNGSVHSIACPGSHRWLWASASRDARLSVGHQREPVQGVPKVPGNLGPVKRLDGHKSWRSSAAGSRTVPSPAPRCFWSEQWFLFLLYSPRAMDRMHLQESHSPNLHRSYFSFFPLHPLVLFANRSPGSTCREAGGYFCCCPAPPSPSGGHSISDETSATWALTQWFKQRPYASFQP